ncbi:hypothetical protein [uncultured Sunxiuqinia sp.]|uniref:hypothetical protein n=1 Tax=uncultured Sunxiuqinia sp. TaxID=1573825 RepID=UPI002AA8E538|nr:hypothetical protein [uncultured Sunxiuqinia sp.]
MKKIYFTLLISILVITNLFAQSYGNYKKVPFAFGLFPPVSTNGTNAGNCINQVSMNLISGYSGGLAGFEFSAFSNTERDFVRGAQFAGFLNFVNGDFTGYQFAGFANFNRSVARGFQFAGFANFNYAEANGLLFAGFANFTKGKSLALQMAGFANFCEDVQGIQGSGFANIVKGNGKAFQMTGFANITLGEVNGTQLAGFLNYSKEKMQKVQIAGFSNISMNDAKGLQLAGFANLAKGTTEGAQIAGFLNVAKQVDGLQLGVINVSDTVKSGLPIGFLSIVRHGFYELEISASEALNTQALFKIGVDKFYNIFAVGSQFLGDEFNWGFGYGMGTHIVNNERFKTQLELISYHINEGKNWINTYNDLNQFRINFTKKIGNNLDVFAGPNFNLMITNNKIIDGRPFESDFAPYSIYSHKGKRTTLKGWIGFSAGIHFN